MAVLWWTGRMVVASSCSRRRGACRHPFVMLSSWGKLPHRSRLADPGRAPARCSPAACCRPQRRQVLAERRCPWWRRIPQKRRQSCWTACHKGLAGHLGWPRLAAGARTVACRARSSWSGRTGPGWPPGSHCSDCCCSLGRPAAPNLRRRRRPCAGVPSGGTPNCGGKCTGRRGERSGRCSPGPCKHGMVQHRARHCCGRNCTARPVVHRQTACTGTRRGCTASGRCSPAPVCAHRKGARRSTRLKAWHARKARNGAWRLDLEKTRCPTSRKHRTPTLQSKARPAEAEEEGLCAAERGQKQWARCWNPSGHCGRRRRGGTPSHG
mmetsp:Transcript_66770/g.207201  ORF Transcript_66770/g.207201 Transcript_66770/m.207201 type:complete len:324 (-) Transcript_66770:214-1185(-)